MNYITRLTAQGLKSGDFTHELSRVNLIVGPSFSGKSSRIEALRLGLIGYVPELGKQPGSTIALARNGQMTVTLTDSEGRTNWREWRRKCKGVSTKEDCHLPACPPVLMDPTVYFSLSDAKKVEYVFGLYQMDERPEFSGPAISAAVQNIRPEPSTPATEEMRRELVAELDESDTARHDAGQPIQEWLGQQIAALKDRLSLARRSVQRMAQAGQAITQLSGDEIPVDRSKEIDAARAGLAKIQESIGSLEANLRQFDALTRRRAEAERAVPSLKPVPDHGARIEQLVERIAQLERETDAGLTEQIEGLRERIERLERETANEPTTEAEERAVRDLKFETGKLAATIQEMEQESVQLTAEEAEKLKRPCCPECGTPAGREMRDRIQVEYHRKIEHLDNARRTAAESLATLNAALAKAEAGLVTALNKRAEWQVARAALAKDRCNLQHVTNLRSDAQTSRAREVSILRKGADSLAGEARLAEQANQGRVDALARLKALDDELGQWQPESIKTKLEDQKLARADLEQRIRELTDRHQAFERHRADEQRQAQAAIEQERAGAEVQVLGEAIKALEDFQARMVASAFGDILAVVNRITDGILDAPIEYRDGQLGRWSAGTFIPHETFSGTEKALTYAGISLALARSAPIKIVLLDELGRLNDGPVVSLLRRLVELTEAGEVGQFVGCVSLGESTEEEREMTARRIASFQIDGVNLIDLTK